MCFEHLDLSNFWNDCDYSLKHYVMDNPTNDLIRDIENKLGYSLPKSYIELMKLHNGGMIKNNCYVMKDTTTWAPDHIIVTGIIGIGREKTYSLCGTLGSEFMINEWGYPPIGICICDTPSAGQEMIMLDYRGCGKDGEPQVVFVDKLFDYKITFVAKNFETFINGLVSGAHFDNLDEEEDEIDDENWIEEKFMDD